MPYSIKKVPGANKYFVVSDASGKHLSNEPMPLERAKKQLAAVNIAYAAERKN